MNDISENNKVYEQMNIEDLWNQFDQMKKPIEIPSHRENYYLCSVCGGAKLFIPNDLPVCSVCGVVDRVYISEEPEWISAAGEEDHSRCGGIVDDCMFSAEWSIGTKITSTNFDYASRKMSRIHFHMSMNHRDRSLFHAYSEIEHISRKLGLSDLIIDDAKMRYKEFTEKKLTRGEVRKGVKANCIFLACKKYGYPRTTKEIADAFGIETKDIGRTSTIVDEVTTHERKKVTMPADIIVRIFENMNCEIHEKSKKIRQCVKVCSRIERDSKLMGKTPSGIASAVIYIVMNDSISKSDVCKSANISVPTLNKLEMTIRQILLKQADAQ
jgi:transcription initiation factor TFIIIB Brf1 subunit/transcription initiation factor TFIIB